MQIKVITVGKLKEKYLVNAVAEYSKRLSAYCKLSFVEVNDEKTKENVSQKEIDIVKDKEGERILSKIKQDEYVITLEIEGKQITSEDLASQLEKITTYHSSKITFVIGGSLGLSGAVSKRSNFKLSFSKMTFPHQLMKVILLEQVYRGFRINNNEPYHK
jgi:23S rRNA (pseudouridine1915-N3)-methyltransferase